MTETDFLHRLQRELLQNQAWDDIDAAFTCENDPTLAGNELLVFPMTHEDGTHVLRVVVEPLTESGIET